MGPTEINKDGSFYRTQRSSALAVLKLPPPPPPTKKKERKKSVLSLSDSLVVSVVYLCITANTLQDSDSQENHNELYIYNYALAKFLLANRVNVFAIYLVVIA